MKKKYKNKYLDGPHRLESWNYNREASYFITMNTKNRIQHFGTIENGIMDLSSIGTIASIEWGKTASIREDMNIKLDSWVVMPDHFHAIIHIGKNKYNSSTITMLRDPTMHRGSTLLSDPEKPHNPKYKNQFGSQSKNIASIIRGYKSAVTIQARKINPNFAWQANYYDRIIWDSNALNRTRKYIDNNIKNWRK